ncbi:TerB family tellurite resistance protein [Methylobacterium haplocladii]|uniref:Molecular chaperone DjlA n=1 Tax=Methylobacterium haplocladii TaxID=1176176 RepID=A0A512IV84_9HYPH|nr:TerB family tellurite resistance protein [Methylobacterium haplocladii]GEP01603.1 molecular chaperone DjlA [Methylobacterium haplocladii]GJD86373.1 Co-chaperone protein DjlA [Methylobacterium haplocladii]GLS61531.1 molecular chaperone DjlA [Methylobacterium haplocladii]
MSLGIWGKIGGAGLGALVGGPIGALAGSVAGHFLVDREGAPFGATPRDVVFTTDLVALAAKMAKSDGVVTPAEVEAFGQVVEVEPGARAGVERLFDLAKATTDGFEGYAGQLASTFHDEPALLEDVLDGLFHIAKADGAIHENEERYLRAVARIFGLDDAAFERLAARHVRLADDPYLVLGIERAASAAEQKARYRALVAENHPDRAIARGLPPEAVAIATRRLAAINAAWDRIAAERGIT